jgi:hypothetical protein
MSLIHNEVKKSEKIGLPAILILAFGLDLVLFGEPLVLGVLGRRQGGGYGQGGSGGGLAKARV